MEMKLILEKKLFSLFMLVLSKVSGIWNLATKDTGFITRVRLVTSFLRTVARRFMEWGRRMVAEEVEVVLFWVHLSSLDHYPLI